MAKNYENLEVWQKAITFALLVYRLTKSFPREELYGLTSQLRRSAISISSNIAEGAGRNSRKEFLRFVLIGLGSLNEAESQIHVSYQLGYVKENEFQEMMQRVGELGNLLGGLRNYLNKPHSTSHFPQSKV